MNDPSQRDPKKATERLVRFMKGPLDDPLGETFVFITYAGIAMESVPRMFDPATGQLEHTRGTKEVAVDVAKTIMYLYPEEFTE